MARGIKTCPGLWNQKRRGKVTVGDLTVSVPSKHECYRQAFDKYDGLCRYCHALLSGKNSPYTREKGVPKPCSS